MNSLGLDKKPADTRVVVAMSGGVDSSVTAAMLADEGYEVIGITLQLYDHGMAIGKKGACCAGQDIYDAKLVAERIGFPHYVLDYESRFRESVIDDFADSYLRGETPIPCVRCNQNVKFKDLLITAKDLGADLLATGHYVQRKQVGTRGELHRAAELRRDQSYFLFATTQEQIDFLRFPLGNLPKAETRALALRYGLEVADKPDSQDICFVPDGDYARVVSKLRPDASAPGDIVDLSGKVLGHHEGIINFTVGQRRGIGIGGTEEPLYVLRVDAPSRKVVVGPRAALGRDLIFLKEVNWLGEGPLSDHPQRVSAKLRSAMSPIEGQVVGDGQGGAILHLDEPHQGVAPGQAGVFYQDSRVLGGGWITATDLKQEAA